MQPMRTPLKTELGLPASSPKTPRGRTADAARTAVPPRNALRVVRLSMAFCVMFPSSNGGRLTRFAPADGIIKDYALHGVNTMERAARDRLLQDVEAFCGALRPIEERCYLERRFNDRVVPLAREHGLLGMPVPVVHGGRGADMVTYARALARIGREGTGVRTFFSGHTSIGEYPILTWGSEDQKRRYLPAAARGDKILAFGLTEPDAGSNPLEMTSTWEKRGDHYHLSGEKYLIPNGHIAQAMVTFAYPKNS